MRAFIIALAVLAIWPTAASACTDSQGPTPPDMYGDYVMASTQGWFEFGNSWDVGCKGVAGYEVWAWDEAGNPVSAAYGSAIDSHGVQNGMKHEALVGNLQAGHRYRFQARATDGENYGQFGRAIYRTTRDDYNTIVSGQVKGFQQKLVGARVTATRYDGHTETTTTNGKGWYGLSVDPPFGDYTMKYEDCDLGMILAYCSVPFQTVQRVVSLSGGYGQVKVEHQFMIP